MKRRNIYRLSDAMVARLQNAGHFGGLQGYSKNTDNALLRRGYIEWGSTMLKLTSMGKMLKTEIEAGRL